jgi:hypothetical protein
VAVAPQLTSSTIFSSRWIDSLNLVVISLIVFTWSSDGFGSFDLKGHAQGIYSD